VVIEEAGEDSAGVSVGTAVAEEASETAVAEEASETVEAPETVDEVASEEEEVNMLSPVLPPLRFSIVCLPLCV